MVKEYNMSRLLTTDIIPTVKHFFKHIAVADLSTHGIDLIFVHKTVKSEIAHNGDYRRVVFKLTHFLHIARKDSNKLVTVYYIASFVNGKASVRIAVKSKTHVTTTLFNKLDKLFHMGRTTVIVYVKTVRLVVYIHIFSTELIEQRFGCCTGTAVCTVYCNEKPLKLSADSRLNMLVVLAYSAVHCSYSADIRAVNKLHLFGSIKYQCFYLVFHVIRELESR